MTGTHCLRCNFNPSLMTTATDVGEALDFAVLCSSANNEVSASDRVGTCNIVVSKLTTSTIYENRHTVRYFRLVNTRPFSVD